VTCLSLSMVIGGIEIFLSWCRIIIYIIHTNKIFIQVFLLKQTLRGNLYQKQETYMIYDNTSFLLLLLAFIIINIAQRCNTLLFFFLLIHNIL